MLTLLKFKAVLAILIGFIISIVFFTEIACISKNTDEYIHVYNISRDSVEWKYQSIDNFKNWNLIAAIIGVFYVSLNVWSLMGKNIKIKYALFILDLILIFLIFINFYFWSESGFNH